MKPLEFQGDKEKPFRIKTDRATYDLIHTAKQQQEFVLESLGKELFDGFFPDNRRTSAHKFYAGT